MNWLRSETGRWVPMNGALVIGHMGGRAAAPRRTVTTLGVLYRQPAINSVEYSALQLTARLQVGEAGAIRALRNLFRSEFPRAGGLVHGAMIDDCCQALSTPSELAYPALLLLHSLHRAATAALRSLAKSQPELWPRCKRYQGNIDESYRQLQARSEERPGDEDGEAPAKWDASSIPMEVVFTIAKMCADDPVTLAALKHSTSHFRRSFEAFGIPLQGWNRSVVVRES
jgi:hypothetical protein